MKGGEWGVNMGGSAVPCREEASPNRASLDRHQQDSDRWILFELLQALLALGCADTAVDLQARDSSILQDPCQGVESTQPGCEDETISRCQDRTTTTFPALAQDYTTDLLALCLCCAILSATAFNLDDVAGKGALGEETPDSGEGDLDGDVPRGVPGARCVAVVDEPLLEVVGFASSLEHSGHTSNPSSRLAESSSLHTSHVLSSLFAFLFFDVLFLPAPPATDKG